MPKKRTRIFITRNIPDEGLKMLRRRKSIHVDIYEKDQKIPRRELLKRVKGADIILSILTEKMDAPVMDAAGPQLKMIANYAVGFNNVDLKAAEERGIVVTNAPNPHISESVAEHAMALIFALAKRVVETDQFARELKYRAWGPEMFLGQDIYGKKLGIVGAGHIGSALAKRMHDGFDLDILYHNPTRNQEFEKRFGAKYRSLNQLLKESDFVSLHVPYLPSTHHLIGEKELQRMKSTAFLINTARGPVIDEKALLEALKTKSIGGAGLDVFECEPSIGCTKSAIRSFQRLQNVVLTPHTASATIETRQAMSRVAAKNILAFLDGKRVPNKVA